MMIFIRLSKRIGIVNAASINRIYYCAEKKAIYALIDGQSSPALVEDNIDRQNADSRMDHYSEILCPLEVKELEQSESDEKQISAFENDKAPVESEASEGEQDIKRSLAGIANLLFYAADTVKSNKDYRFIAGQVFPNDKETRTVEWFGNKISQEKADFLNKNQYIFEALKIDKGPNHKYICRAYVLGAAVTAAQNNKNIDDIRKWLDVITTGKVKEERDYTAKLFRDELEKVQKKISTDEQLRYLRIAEFNLDSYLKWTRRVRIRHNPETYAFKIAL